MFHDQLATRFIILRDTTSPNIFSDQRFTLYVIKNVLSDVKVLFYSEMTDVTICQTTCQAHTHVFSAVIYEENET